MRVYLLSWISEESWHWEVVSVHSTHLSAEAYRDSLDWDGEPEFKIEAWTVDRS